MNSGEPWTQKQIHFCYICNGPGSSEHHLIPKSVQADRLKKVVVLKMRACHTCHHDIHYYFSHWELAISYFTPESLKAELTRRRGISRALGHSGYQLKTYMKSERHYSGRWKVAEAIKDFPDLHSDPMNIKPLLLAIPADHARPVIGWYYGGIINVFRMDGSPSDQYPTHWTTLPELP